MRSIRSAICCFIGVISIGVPGAEKRGMLARVGASHDSRLQSQLAIDDYGRCSDSDYLLHNKLRRFESAVLIDVEPIRQLHCSAVRGTCLVERNSVDCWAA